MQVLVSVGTDHHPFDRLVRWAERWAAAHPDDTVVVQHGATRAPTGVEHAELFSRAEMRSRIERADVVVVSCGPGAVMDVRATGRLPVVVARRADAGEHVDDHQRSFARHLAATSLARCVESEVEFAAVLDEVRADPSAWRVEPPAGAPAGIARIGELIDELVWGN